MPARKTAVIDLDGVLAEYGGWKGSEHFGKPVQYAKDALTELRVWGWRIIVWTTRGNAAAVALYLENNRIPFDVVNSTAHNPPGCSAKPIATVYIDDRSWYDVERRFSWVRVMKRLRKLYQPRPLDLYVDDAAAWAWWPRRLWERYKAASEEAAMDDYYREGGMVDSRSALKE